MKRLLIGFASASLFSSLTANANCRDVTAEQLVLDGRSDAQLAREVLIQDGPVRANEIRIKKESKAGRYIDMLKHVSNKKRLPTIISGERWIAGELLSSKDEIERTIEFEVIRQAAVKATRSFSHSSAIGTKIIESYDVLIRMPESRRLENGDVELAVHIVPYSMTGTYGGSTFHSGINFNDDVLRANLGYKKTSLKELSEGNTDYAILRTKQNPNKSFHEALPIIADFNPENFPFLITEKPVTIKISQATIQKTIQDISKDLSTLRSHFPELKASEPNELRATRFSAIQNGVRNLIQAASKPFRRPPHAVKRLDRFMQEWILKGSPMDPPELNAVAEHFDEAIRTEKYFGAPDSRNLEYFSDGKVRPIYSADESRTMFGFMRPGDNGVLGGGNGNMLAIEKELSEASSFDSKGNFTIQSDHLNAKRMREMMLNFMKTDAVWSVALERCTKLKRVLGAL